MSHSAYPVASGTVSMKRNVLPSRLLTHLLARLTAHMCRKHKVFFLLPLTPINLYPTLEHSVRLPQPQSQADIIITILAKVNFTH